MAEKNMKARIVHKHDTASNWEKATGFIPKKGEIIVYDIDDNYAYERIKIGDGTQNVNALPFATDALETEINGQITLVSQALLNVSSLVGDTAVSTQISNAIAEIPEQVQADWNQNDENATDFVKNRTHYETDEKEIIVVESRTIEGFSGGWATNKTHFVLEDGKTYTVTFDGVEYPGLVSTNDGYGSIILGNRYLWDSEGENNLPFALIYEPGGDGGWDFCYVVSTDEETTTHTFEIKRIGTEIIKIDEKFLPDVVAERGDHISSVVFTKHDATANAPYSFAHGKGCVASGYSSHAEGVRTTAEGEDSHAEGFETKVSVTDVEPGTVYYVSEYNDQGSYAHAEGMSTVAIGPASHAEGAGTKTAASGKYAHAEGLSTLASNNAAHAEGEETIASGDTSHAEGFKTEATGYVSHTEGRETYAKGHYSHAEGYGTKAMYRSQHVDGEYNIVDDKLYTNESYRGNYVRIVGNGTADDARSNAHTLDWSGNAWFNGTVKVGGTSQDDENAKELATQEYVVEQILAMLAARKPKIATVELKADAWVGESNLYSQVVEIDGATEYSQVDLTPSVEQLVVFYEKDLTFVTENDDGVVTVYAIGQKPMNDYTIQVTITEVIYE